MGKRVQIIGCAVQGNDGVSYEGEYVIMEWIACNAVPMFKILNTARKNYDVGLQRGPCQSRGVRDGGSLRRTSRGDARQDHQEKHLTQCQSRG